MATADALDQLAAALRDDDTLLTEHLREPDADPALGLLAAAGPRARGAEEDYAFVVEAVREGYLLHYGEPRVVTGVDRDLALLAGDHLYALGLECLAGLGDLESVRELADLISLSAQLHADGGASASPEASAAGALWLAATTAVTAGAGEAHEAAKRDLRAGAETEAATAALAAAAREAASAAGITSALELAADSIDFDLPDPPAGG